MTISCPHSLTSVGISPAFPQTLFLPSFQPSCNPDILPALLLLSALGATSSSSEYAPSDQPSGPSLSGSQPADKVMADLRPNLYACIITTLTVATLALGLRLRARTMTKFRFWYDDYFSVIAWLFAAAFSSGLLYWMDHWMLGQSIAHLEHDVAEHYLDRGRFTMFIIDFFYAWSIGFSKLSVLCFYWRIFKYSSIRYPIIFLLVASVIWVMFRTFMGIFMCSPIQSFWDDSITTAHCALNEQKYYLSTEITHSLMDGIILILPGIEVLRLHAPLGQRIAIVGLFASGTIVCIASVSLIISTSKLVPHSKELPLHMSMPMLWAAMEINMAIFSSSLPMLRPIFRKYIPGLGSSSSNHPISGVSVPGQGTHLQSLSRARTTTRLGPLEKSESQRKFHVLDHHSDLYSLNDSDGPADSRPDSRRSNDIV